MMIEGILIPVFVQVALTFVLGFWAAGVRFSAVRGGAVRVRDVALREPNWPPHVLKILYAYENQLELPILFYVLVALLIPTRHADLIFVVLAWVFVLLRLVHAYVHVTDNNMARRGPIFIACAVVLAVMWLIFAIRILTGT
jgi:hypothetical protein